MGIHGPMEDAGCRTTSAQAQRGYSRIGAFEIYLGIVLSGGVCSCELIHSKLETSHWPSAKQIVGRVRDRLQHADLSASLRCLDKQTSRPLAGVRVLADSMEMGMTDGEGRLALPTFARLTSARAQVVITCERGEGGVGKKGGPSHRDPIAQHVQLLKVGLDDLLHKGTVEFEAKLVLSARWLRLLWAAKPGTGLRLLAAPGGSSSPPGGEWRSGEGMELTTVRSAAANTAATSPTSLVGSGGRTLIAGPGGWVLIVGDDVSSVIVCPPREQPGFLPATVPLLSLPAAGTEITVPCNRRLLRVLRDGVSPRLRLMMGGSAGGTRPPWRPAEGLSLQAVEEADGRWKACPSMGKGCAWCGPAHLLEGHLSECPRVLAAHAAAGMLRFAKSCALQVSLLWRSGEEPTELQLLLRHPCGAALGGDCRACDRCGGEVFAAQPGCSAGPSAWSIAWPEGNELPHGTYEVCVQRRAGTAAPFDVAISVGGVSRAIAGSSSEEAAVTVASFNVPFQGALLTPDGPLEAREAARWQWSMQCDPGSNEASCDEEALVAVTDAAGWSVVPDQAQTLILHPAPEERGLLPKEVQWAELEGLALKPLDVALPSNSAMLRVLRRGRGLKLEYAISFGGTAALPSGWEPSVGAVVETLEDEATPEQPPTEVECSNSHIGCNWRGSPADRQEHVTECTATHQLMARVKKAGGRSGHIQVSISWASGETPTDLDLKVEHPCPQALSWETEDRCGCGARLDVDDRGIAGDTSVENAFWPDGEGDPEPPKGSYVVVVSHYEGPPVDYKVAVKVGLTTRLFHGRASPGDDAETMKVCGFEWPFPGDFAFPKRSVAGKFRRSVQRISLIRMLSSGSGKFQKAKPRTDRGGWCEVPREASRFIVYPPDGLHLELGPVTVARGDAAKAPDGLLRVQLPRRRR